MSTAHPVLGAVRAWRLPMRPRAVDEEHRAATPLELLFDLTFVVAVAIVAGQLAHAIAADDVGGGLLGYVTVFFAIWWAWMNFTWFASAYDVDDVPYRLVTLIQMAGVLVLAVGIPAAFEARQFSAVVVGYVIMRLAMLVQWGRAWAGDPERRSTIGLIVVGTLVVQTGWVLRTALVPDSLFLPSFLLLGAAELLVPFLAERRGGMNWHPHHIAERYSLFTIIVLGEGVLAVTRALEPAVAQGLTVDLVVMALGGLLILFGAWWLYFLRPAGDGLAGRRRLSFLWGYGHFVVFASLAALAAGLDVAAETLAHEIEASATLVSLAVGVPLALFMLTGWALHASLGIPGGRAAVVPAGGVVTVAIAAIAPGLVPLPWAVLAVAAPITLVLMVETLVPVVGRGSDSARSG